MTVLLHRALARAGACLAALAFAASAFAAAPAQTASEPIAVPKLTARVTDQTGTLTAAERDALERKLATFESAHGSQVAVLIVPTIGPETIEEFAGRVTDEWKLGRKGVDDGVLLAIAKQERRIRVHTGRGVQGTLTDAVSKRIASDIVAAKFRSGDFAGGINDGVDAIMKSIEGEELPLPAARSQPGTGKSQSGGDGFGNLAMLAFFLVPVAAMVLRGMFGRFFGAAATAGVTGVAAWFLIGSVAIVGIAAVIAFLFTLFSGMDLSRGIRPGGWGGGGFGGGGFGGGGGGGGGFSGGGGGFDGGGASGSW